MNALGGWLLVAMVSTAGAEETVWRVDAASESGRVVATNGLFPIWENTGVLLAPQRVYLGSSQLAAALGPQVQLGLNPLRFAFRTPNLGAKVALVSSQRVKVAAAVDVLWLMPGSSDVFSTSNFSTRLDTTQTSVIAVPLALAVTTAITPTVFVHTTVTQLFTVMPGKPVQTASGASVVAEWRPLAHHAVAAHATEVGFWRHEFFQFGASYRYQRSIFEGRLGVAYQLRPDGPRVVPALSLGVEL